MRTTNNEHGDSLIEILAAVAVLGIGITGLLTALATQASTTVVNRSQAQASTTLLAAAEYVKALPYTACGPGSAVVVPPTDPRLPHDAIFTVTYGPGQQLASNACSALTVVPITVSGDGFDLSAQVVKRG